MKSVALALTLFGLPALAAPTPTTTVVRASEVKWEHLNPARGDKAPSAGTLWGDRNGTVATGYLLRPKDGFRSPPHIHNVSYRGVVIRGEIHNDDPNAAELWMGPGAFWTQPKGDVHITAARGDTLAYIEIESGPYLVKPVGQAFGTPERPVNVAAPNVVWLDASATKWVTGAGPQVAFLWGPPTGLSGAFVRLPAGWSGVVEAKGETFGAVVVQGTPTLKGAGALEPGSYFGSGAAAHALQCESACVLYVRSTGFEVR